VGGLPSLRLKGDYLAIVTLGFGEIVRAVVQQAPPALKPVRLSEPGHALDGQLVYEWVSRAADGSRVVTHTAVAKTPFWDLCTHVGGSLGFSQTPKYTSLFWVTLAAVITVVVALRIKRSTFGRAFLSIREDEVAAEAMGIDTLRYKLYAFLLSAVGPGIVGGLSARDQGYIEPISVFPLIMTITMIVMALFGGKGTIWGPVLGAVLLFTFQEMVWARFVYLHQLLFGAIIVAVVLLMPRGILGVLQQRYNLPRTV
jgi:branched-chain amino acid transport system permease protein